MISQYTEKEHDNNEKRWIALLLAILVALPTLAACGGSGEGADTTTAYQDGGDQSTTAATTVATTETTDGKAVANVPADANYADHTFTFYISGNIENDREKNDFGAENITGEALNDAIYTRNMAIEDKLGIKIATVEDYDKASEGKGKAYKRLTTAYTAGDTDLDAAMICGYDCSTLAYTGYLYDLNKLPYVDVAQPWWDQKVNTDLTINGKLFYSTGDISTADNDATCAILFNKDLAAENNLEDHYKLVEDGKWTIDKMAELAKTVVADLNGDGAYDANDRVGAIIWDDTMMALVNGAGVRCCTLDDKGELVLTLNDERTLSVIDKVSTYFYADEMGYAYQRISYDITTPLSMFSNKQALYYTQLLDLVSYLRDSETDFGILPHPKLTEEQKEYYNTIGSYHSVFLCVPGVQEDAERTGVILESLAAESQNIVTPAYYEQTLVGKYVRDEESVATLDIILATRVYDLGWFYQIGNYPGVIMNLWRNHKSDFNSVYKPTERIALKTLQTINDAFAKLD